MSKIAVIGPGDYLGGFRALGVSFFPAVTPEAAGEALSKASSEGAAVIFISEDFAEALREKIEELRDRPLPAVVLLPGIAGSQGAAEARVKRDIRRAIGAEIW